MKRAKIAIFLVLAQLAVLGKTEESKDQSVIEQQDQTLEPGKLQGDLTAQTTSDSETKTDNPTSDPNDNGNSTPQDGPLILPQQNKDIENSLRKTFNKIIGYNYVYRLKSKNVLPDGHLSSMTEADMIDGTDSDSIDGEATEEGQQVGIGGQKKKAKSSKADDDDSDEESSKKMVTKKVSLDEHEPKQSINSLAINNINVLKNNRKNKSYKLFIAKHKRDFKMAHNDKKFIHKSAVEKKKKSRLKEASGDPKKEDVDEESNEIKRNDICKPSFKNTFFDEIDFDSETAKLPDGAIRNFCLNIDSTCCSANEIKKRFEMISKTFEPVLTDLKLMYEFFKYMKQQSDKNLELFFAENREKIALCTDKDPVEFFTSLYEFKHQSKNLSILYWNYIKNAISDAYSLQCGICEGENKKNFYIYGFTDITLTMTFEELFYVLEKVKQMMIMNIVFQYASFLECYVFGNGVPVSFSPSTDDYTVKGFIEKKINFVSVDSKKVKKFEPKKENIAIIPSSVNRYIQEYHIIFGLKLVGWGKLKQITEYLLENRDTSELKYNKILKRLDFLEFGNPNDDEQLSLGSTTIVFETTGFDHNDATSSSSNVYYDNDMEDLKFVRLYNGSAIASVLVMIACFLAVFEY